QRRSRRAAHIERCTIRQLRSALNEGHEARYGLNEPRRKPSALNERRGTKVFSQAAQKPQQQRHSERIECNNDVARGSATQRLPHSPPRSRPTASFHA